MGDFGGSGYRAEQIIRRRNNYMPLTEKDYQDIEILKKSLQKHDKIKLEDK
jgi:hypothetical protein